MIKEKHRTKARVTIHNLFTLHTHRLPVWQDNFRLKHNYHRVTYISYKVPYVDEDSYSHNIKILIYVFRQRSIQLYVYTTI